MTGPSTPREERFNPLGTAIGVFAAVAIPVFVFGYTEPSGPSAAIIAIGVLAGLLLGIVAGVWVAQRGGWVWRGPRS